MKIFFFVCSIQFLSINLCDGQYITHYTEPNHVKSTTLIDSTTGVRFVLDSNHINVTAIKPNGRILWATDPWKDVIKTVYRIERPVIVYFQFEKIGWKGNKEFIALSYNNSQFGFLDKINGKFIFEGQD